MGIRIQKPEMAHQLICLVVYLLLASFGALAREWCPNPSRYGYALRASGISFGPYPTDMAALQAAMDAYQYGGNQRTTVISCNGQGVCTACFNWISECNNNATVWNGYDDFLNRLPGSYSLILPCDCRMLSGIAAGLTTCTSSLSITLSGGTEVEPSSTSSTNTLPVIATVKDQSTGQPPTSPVKVHISLKVEPNSGGHEHGDSARPRGGIANAGTCPSDSKCWEKKTDGNGAVVFNFNAPEASGTHTITATCDGCSNTATKTVYVKVTGLEPIAGSILYTKIMPNADTNHPNTNYLTTEAMARLEDIGLQYTVTGLIDFGMVLPPLQINDASLKWGGILDCFLTCINSKPWGPSHEEHRKGTVVDIRANGGTGSIPTSAKMTENFIALTRKAILSKYPESTVTIAAAHGKGTGRHFHVRLLGRKE